MTAWVFGYDGFDPGREGLREALCTLGNGYFCTRGAACEADADGTHYPGTYLAGGYDRLGTEVAGRVVENEDLVNLPNWLPLSFRVNGGSWFRLGREKILSYRQELDLERGVLRRSVRFEDVQGRRTGLEERRLVHMGNPHLAALELRLSAENWAGRLEVRSALDGRVTNEGVERYRRLAGDHLEPLEAGEVDGETLFLLVRTVQSRLRVAQAARTRLWRGRELLLSTRRAEVGADRVAHHLELEVGRGDEVRVEKVVSLYTSRDRAVSEAGLEARKEVARAADFEELLRSHARAWAHLWRRFDLRIELADAGDGERTARILRLHLFHLLQTVSPHTMDLDAGVPSRGWHGEAYRGHVFWDELFIFPLFNLRLPEITRSLLQYRYRRIGEARAAAAAAGCRGAMYPWQSGSDGREESQSLHLNPESGRWIPDNSRLQRHVNAAIAYNVWHYYQATRDTAFLHAYGAEMMLEIARFWAGVARRDRGSDRYDILGVMGPDEYHDAYPGADEPGLDNNAYTNVMAAWTLARALEVLDLLPEDRRAELRETLDLGEEELAHWDEVSRRLRVPFHDGVISQFQGYGDLEELDWEGYRERYGDISRLDRILEAEGDTPNRYKASKQADVLMLFYLLSTEELTELFGRLGYPFDGEDIPRNVEYYAARTSHGSTLSRVTHSWVLARSDRVGSWELFTQALESDVSDVQGGTTPEGIHLGAMAGTVDLVKRCYTGIETRGDTLWLNPRLPQELRCLRMDLRYRGHSLRLEVETDRVRVTSLRCREGPIRVGLGGRVRDLPGGRTVAWNRKEDTGDG